MLLNGKPRTSFDNISQRMLYGIIISFADFMPIKSEKVTEEAQRSFYNIIKNIALSLYNHPDKIDLPISPDDYFRAFQCGNQRPELDLQFKEISANIRNFYKTLYFTGAVGSATGDTIKLDTKYLKDAKIKFKQCFSDFLSEVGIQCVLTKNEITFTIPKHADFIAAWQLLAKNTLHTEITDKSRGVNSVEFGLLKFTCGLYNDDFTYYRSHVEKLHELPDGFFKPYLDELSKLGFYYDTFGDLFSVEFKLRGKVSGFAIRYAGHRYEQFYFMAENCQGAKAILSNFDKLSPAVQDYMVRSCRKCSSCLGCTKGGKAKIFTVNVNYKGENVALCPQFPQREWFEPDEKLMSDLIEYIKLQEIYGK